MKRPNIPQGDWNVCRHATPESSPQFGVYTEDHPSDFLIVKGDRSIADVVAAVPELLAVLENLHVWLIAPDTTRETLEWAERKTREALIKAGYEF